MNSPNVIGILRRFFKESQTIIRTGQWVKTRMEHMYFLCTKISVVVLVQTSHPLSRKKLPNKLLELFTSADQFEYRLKQLIGFLAN
jgi:hypothetical protein